MQVLKNFVPEHLAEKLFAAGIFVLGAGVGIHGWQYGLGQLNDIGPGAFPLALGILLMALSARAVATAAVTVGGSRRTPVFCVVAGIAAWGLLIERAGLLVATLALIFICGLANERFRPLPLLGLALALTAAGYVVFVLGFNLPLTLLGR